MKDIKMKSDFGSRPRVAVMAGAAASGAHCSPNSRWITIDLELTITTATTTTTSMITTINPAQFGSK
jgi:hypothetical protein